MKNLYIFCIIFCGLQSISAQTLVPIVENAPQDKAQNFVIFADGYQAGQMQKFIDDATMIANGFFNESPYKEYRNFYNFYGIFRSSINQGADHPGTATDVSEPGSHPVLSVNTAYNSTFDYNGIHRLLVAQNTTKVFNDLASLFPNYDAVLVLSNTTFYGGSGGAIATSSLHSSAVDLAIHEIGHSYVNLADEYWAGIGFAAEKPNMTANNNPATVKWESWLNNNGIGIFEHSCGSCGWYKPHNNCMMQFLGSPFCNVCKEATVDVMYQTSSPLTNKIPNVNSQFIFNGSTITFGSNLIYPIPNTYDIDWYVNGTRINSRTNETESFHYNDFDPGINSLEMIVNEGTTLTKENYKWTLSWSVNKVNLCPSSTVVTNTNSGYSNTFPVGSDAGQPTNDDFDWQVTTGTTPTANTGPNSARHGSTYLYAEADPGTKRTANWISNCIDVSASDHPHWIGYYHMEGRDIGYLNFDVSSDGGQTFTGVVELEGEQSSGWIPFSLDLLPFKSAGVVLRIRATTLALNGSGPAEGDIAVDHFRVQDRCLSPNSIYGSGLTHTFDETIYRNNFISSSATVAADVTYDTGDHISLLENFNVQLGSEFLAIIETCKD